jgi:hypothetical protein
VALNFTVSYTFSSGTTISSSQVNTNTSDVANVFIGLEALTKSFSALRVDATPTSATDAAIKSYVDKLNSYRRPVLQFGSVTTVAVESGLDGTSGDIPLLFPDGTLRTETSTTRTTFNITRNAVLVTSGAQSGLTGATSEATNTWYALYGCKVTDSSTLWCTVGSTVLPIQANFSTLNTAYGTNGWVYLGLIRNGDNSGATGDILNFYQSGAITYFSNVAAGNSNSNSGIRVATSASTGTLTYTPSSGTGTTDIPNHVTQLYYGWSVSSGSSTTQFKDSTTGALLNIVIGTSASAGHMWYSAADSMATVNGSSVSMDIYFAGFADKVLGVGANPIL